MLRYSQTIQHLPAYVAKKHNTEPLNGRQIQLSLTRTYISDSCLTHTAIPLIQPVNCQRRSRCDRRHQPLGPDQSILVKIVQQTANRIQQKSHTHTHTQQLQPPDTTEREPCVLKFRTPGVQNRRCKHFSLPTYGVCAARLLSGPDSGRFFRFRFSVPLFFPSPSSQAHAHTHPRAIRFSFFFCRSIP